MTSESEIFQQASNSIQQRVEANEIQNQKFVYF